MKGKKGNMYFFFAFVLIIVAVLAVMAGRGGMGDKASDSDSTLAIGEDGDPVTQSDVEETAAKKEVTSCNGIASVLGLYNDIDAYKKSTDPNGTITIFERNSAEFQATIADDATSTTLPVMSNFKGLAGNNLGANLSGYFAKEIEFSTVCSDLPIQPELYAAGAPTLTVTNDNGKTLNSDSTHEAADASSTYTPCVTIKAPSNKCSAVYGAVIALEFDATYVKKISSSDLSTSSFGFLEAHDTNHSGTGLDMDQYVVKKWAGEDGMLCNGEKVDICFDVETTSSAPGEDQANVKFHWYPINKDLEAYTLAPITGIYDEDNNLISPAATSVIYYTG